MHLNVHIFMKSFIILIHISDHKEMYHFYGGNTKFVIIIHKSCVIIMIKK